MQLQRATLHIIGTNTPCSFWLLPWKKSINSTSLIIHDWVGPISYSRFSYLHCKQAHTQHRNILHVFTVTILLTYLFIYLYIYSFIHSFIHLFVCLFVYFFLLGGWGDYHAHQALNMFCYSNNCLVFCSYVLNLFKFYCSSVFAVNSWALLLSASIKAHSLALS